MAIWYFNKTIACGTTIAATALVYYIITLHNRREKKETDKVDNKAFEIKITNTSSPNIHNKRQVFSKNSDNQNNMPELSKIRQIVSPVSNQSTSNNPIKPSRSKRYQIQSKVVDCYNSIMQNSARFFTNDESSETIILNNSALSFKFDNQDNLNRSLVIHIDNSIDSNNRVQIKAFNKSTKLLTLNIKTLYAPDNPSTNNSLIMINQKNESKEIDITIPFNRRRVVEHIMTPREDRLTKVHNNKYTKEIEKNNVTITINAST